MATGSEPFEIPSIPFDGKNVISSTDILSITKIPKSMLVLGGGVIGCEFACIFNALGSSVTVVEALDRVLPLDSVDSSVSKLLTREFKKKKIKLITGRSVTKVEPDKDGALVTISDSPLSENSGAKSKAPETVKVEKVLISVGRSPNHTNLGLTGLGVEMDEKGWIKANLKMETNVPGIYAVGDALGPAKVMLAHAAYAEGSVAAKNACGGDQKMD